MCRHCHLVQVHAKIDKDTIVEPEQELLRAPVIHKLLLGVYDRLSRELILQFNGDERNAIQGENHINRVVVVGGICELSGALQDILMVAFHQVSVQVAARLEVAEPDCHASVLDSIAQHVY